MSLRQSWDRPRARRKQAAQNCPSARTCAVTGETRGGHKRIQQLRKKGFHVEQIFDFDAVRRHRDRAARRIMHLTPVLSDLAERVLDRLEDTSRHFTTALDFGGRGVIAPALQGRGMSVDCADISAPMAAIAGGTPLLIDSENFQLERQRYDLVVAHLSLHWFTDLPGALIQLRQTLKPEGLLLASLPALGTLQELRTALLDAEESLTGGVSPRVSPFPELSDCAGLLQRAGFSLPVADVEEIEFLYANPFALLHDLRDAGETNALRARRKKFAPADLFPAALSQLPQRDGRIIARLRMAVLTGWAS
jgi:NADH dehydrogenase [ubiquinone] 1 alpha subcomplex assembly factor 5